MNKSNPFIKYSRFKENDLLILNTNVMLDIESKLKEAYDNINVIRQRNNQQSTSIEFRRCSTDDLHILIAKSDSVAYYAPKKEIQTEYGTRGFHESAKKYALNEYKAAKELCAKHPFSRIEFKNSELTAFHVKIMLKIDHPLEEGTKLPNPEEAIKDMVSILEDYGFVLKR